jgi:cytochrome P450
MLLLISTPNVYAALRREIDDGVASGGPVTRVIRDAEARNMPYLQAVIREGLRLYPPATGLLHKAVPRGGATLHGYELPAGTQVGQNLGGIMRSKELFGDDADTFRPERWLEAAAADDGVERLKAMQAAVDLVFGFGKYQCLGKQIALTELNKVFVEVSMCFSYKGLAVVLMPLGNALLTVCMSSY